MNMPELAPSSTAEQSGRSLVDQAAGMTRAQILKQVVCEPLSRELEPVFRPLEESELKILPNIGASPKRPRLESWVNLLSVQTERRINLLSIDLASISTLAKAKKIFYWEGVATTLCDGIKSGISVPAIVAAHIYRLEEAGQAAQAEQEPVENYGTEVDTDKFLAIMGRESFTRILHHLTKGPNGFLGTASTSAAYMWGANFFQFSHPNRSLHQRRIRTLAANPAGGNALPYYDAYELGEGGKVVGLSSLYHLAAQLKREALRADRAQEVLLTRNNPLALEYNPVDSSGCPVRHAYRDRSGQAQPPLFVVARNFVAQALRDSLAFHDQPQQ